MSLYYSDDLVTLFLGNCLEETAWLDADVLVTDPPYGMGYSSSSRKGAKLALVAGDESAVVRDNALALWPARSPALVFGRWSVVPPLGERQRLIWSKGSTPGMGDLSIPWGPSHEDIHLLGRGWDVAATGTKRGPSVITTHSQRGGATGEENATGHPTPKPVPLMEALIERCPPGVIADPFAGSGSTLIAARNLGRHAIGVEIEERYCELIAKRLAQQAFNFGEETL